MAEFWPGSRRGCLKGTRRAVLDKIELWTRNFSDPPVYWLDGLARTGKTAIVQTIAERAFADGQLGASFFCSRDSGDRSNLCLILPTIAVQLARKYADFRSSLVSAVQSHSGIAHESLDNQMQKLIVQPFQESCVSTMVIIDGLDECEDEGPTSTILSVLAQFVSEIPNVKFLVTSRPEIHIREGFRLPSLAEATVVFVLHEVEKSQVNDDIRLFFRREFSEVEGLDHSGLRRQLTQWDLNDLCTQAAGSFVYAVAAVKFIDIHSNSSVGRLDLLLQSPWKTIHETKRKPNKNRTLDSFYASILQGAFAGVCCTECTKNK